MTEAKFLECVECGYQHEEESEMQKHIFEYEHGGYYAERREKRVEVDKKSAVEK